MLPNTTITTNLVGQKIGQYHLISRLGENEFFTVYKAYYRDGYDYVAVKVLHNSNWMAADFLEQFQKLPDTIAGIDYPFLCQLYDRGTQDEVFYLVSEFIDGVTLEAELEARRNQNEAFSLTEIIFIIQTIGIAITRLHNLNLVHGHINTGNILFTIEGIPVLVDSELIHLVNASTIQEYLQKPTPVNLPLSANTDKQLDIEALGSVLYKLMGGEISTGAHSNGRLKFSELTQERFTAQTMGALKEIVRRAIEPDSNNQFQQIMEMVEALRELSPPDSPQITHINFAAQTRLVKQITVATDTTDQFKTMPGVCPYQGLFAFQEENAAFFFGRETFVDQLVNVVQQKPIVMVTGPSGSGKSSVVYAGLVPYLHHGGEWEIAELRPGIQPIQALTASLSPLLVANLTEAERGQKNYQLAEELTNQQTSLSELVDQILQSDNTGRQLLLVIDQFEELYTLCRDETIRQKFLDMLLEATAAPVFQRKLNVVLTLRVDFLGQVLTHRDFADKLYQADIKLGPMNRNELARAIENPAVRQGVKFEEGLVKRILHDVGHEPGALPLLQFALTQLWGEQQNGQLTHRAYESINGVTGALARYADRVYLELTEPQQIQARRVFMQLVRPGEGTEDTRRLAYRSDLDDADWQLAQQLVDARLVVAGRTPDEQETVEVVHEALIWEWQKLRGWINEDRAFRTWQERLRAALRQWEASSYDEGALLRGVLLAEAESWFDDRWPDLSQVEQDYIQASISLRKQREVEQLEAQQVRERSRRIVTASLAMGLVIAMLLAIFAWQQWQQAKDQQQIALSNQLAAQALSRLDSQEYDLAQLLSLEANRLVDSLESRSALLMSLQRSPYRHILRHYKNPVLATALSPNSRLLATLEADDTIELTDANTGKVINQLEHGLLGVNTIAFGPNNQLLASADDVGQIIIWDISNPDNPQVFQSINQADGVGKVAFSPDGKMLAAGGTGSQVILWDVATGTRKGSPLTGHTGDVRSLAFSPNGRWLVTGSIDDGWATIDETVLLWDLSETTPQSYPLSGLIDNVNDVAFSTDGRNVAASSTNGDIMLWNVETQESVSEPMRHISGEQSASVTLPKIKIAFSPDRRTLASGGLDGDIILWDLETGKPRREPLPARAGTVNHLEFSRDGHTLVSANNDGAAILWAIDQQLGDSLPDLEQRIWSLAFGPTTVDRPQLISGSEDGTVNFWDVANRQPTRQPLNGHTLHINSVAVSPTNTDSPGTTILATASDDQTVRLWDLATGQLLADPLVGHTDGVLDVTFSPDGQILASAGRDGTIILWDMSTFQPIGTPLTAHKDGVWEVAFSFDGKILASASWDGTIILWNTLTGKSIGSPLTGHTGAVVSLAASPNERILASTGRDGTIIVWDLATAQPVNTLLHNFPGTVWRVAFSPNGKTLASAGCAQLTTHGNCEQGEVRLWDVVTGRQLGQSFVGHQDLVWSIAFSPDGSQLASNSRDGTVIIWDLDQESWIKRACAFANRNLSKAEWLQYLGDELYHATCISNETGAS